eukprot:654708-Pyramimonas_sp.AAC.2
MPLGGAPRQRCKLHAQGGAAHQRAQLPRSFRLLAGMHDSALADAPPPARSNGNLARAWRVQTRTRGAKWRARWAA